jgi:hypothetical protein
MYNTLVVGLSVFARYEKYLSLRNAVAACVFTIASANGTEDRGFESSQGARSR